MRVCTYARTYVRVCVRTYVSVRTYVRTCLCVYICTYVCVYVCMCTYDLAEPFETLYQPLLGEDLHELQEIRSDIYIPVTDDPISEVE